MFTIAFRAAVAGVALSAGIVAAPVHASERPAPEDGASASPVRMARCVSGEYDADVQPVFPCVWDARHQGNGRGDSLIMRRNRVVVIRHARAHRLWAPVR